ncbi:MAG: DUF1640 domain-containing protein [Magnetococcales bacterium]|nr:DUF1640 domain-containing protein [Magnetococcales bacterium]
MSTTAFAVPFDTLAFVKKLESAGVPSPQAEAQAEALTGVFQKVEESRMPDLATKGDVLELKRDIAAIDAKMETSEAELKRDMKEMELRMVIKMAGMILACVGMIVGYLRVFPMPVQIVQPSIQEMRQTALVPAPPPALLVPPAAAPTQSAR